MGVRVYDVKGIGTHHNAHAWRLGSLGELEVLDVEQCVLAVYAPRGWISVMHYRKPEPEKPRRRRVK